MMHTCHLNKSIINKRLESFCFYIFFDNWILDLYEELHFLFINIIRLFEKINFTKDNDLEILQRCY
ncbi:hypothetical protein HZS_1110 [Henneguya salminicola]|nr:hypothetical protein HZS_1110 [Henneguya salminicola]